MEWAQKAVELQPGNPKFLDTLALAYQSTGEVAKAQTVLESVVKQYPKFLDGKYSLARLYDRTGDTRRAVRLYESILQQSDDYPRAKDIRERLSQLGN